MKRILSIGIVLVILISGCAPAIEAEPTIASNIPSTPMATLTSTSLPTATRRPSATPAPPTVTITPIIPAPTVISPLALNEFNAASEMQRLNIIGTGSAHDLEFSPDGSLLAVATGRGVYLYDGTTFEQTGFLDVNDSVSEIAFSPAGDVLAVAVDGKASLWNVSSRKQMMSLDGGLVGISKLAYGKGGYVAAIGGDCRGCGTPVLAMILWNAKTGRQIYVERDIWYLTDALAFTADGSQLFYGGADGLSIIEAESGRPIDSNMRVNQAVKVSYPYAVLPSKNDLHWYITSFETSNHKYDFDTQSRERFQICGPYLTGAGDFGVCFKDEKIIIFDLSTGGEIQRVDIGFSPSSYEKVLFGVSPDGQFLVYEQDSVVRVRNLRDNSLFKELPFSDFDSALAGQIILDGIERNVVAVPYPLGQISLLEIGSDDILRTFKMDCCKIQSFAFAPDKKTVATIGEYILQVWDASSLQVIRELEFRPQFSAPIAFSPDGSKVFLVSTFSGSHTLQYDLQSGQATKLGSVYHNSGEFFGASQFLFYENGDLVSWKYQEPSLLFFDSNGQTEITIPLTSPNEFDAVYPVAVNFNSRYWALGRSTDVFIWDAQIDKATFYLVGHERRGGDGWSGSIQSLLFAPQSNLLVSVGADRTTRLWNINTGNEIRRLNVCCSASFTPDGRYLVTAGDGVIRVWGVP